LSTWWDRLWLPPPPRARAAGRRRGPGVKPLEDRRVPSTLVALSTGNQLLASDSGAPGTVQGRLPVTGLQPGESLLGIDFRPSTGQLYGLGSSDRLYVIDTNSGAAAAVGTGSFRRAVQRRGIRLQLRPGGRPEPRR
jgi:hypothetical protein